MVKRSLTHHQTTTFERFLLITTGTLLPLEDHIPAIGGFSIIFILISLMTGYVFLYRHKALGKTWVHPVFIAGYTIVTVGTLMEFFQPHSDINQILRFGLMIAGATMVASLCRDRGALQAGIYGYLIAGLGISGLLFLTSFGILQEATANNFAEAGKIRSEAFKDAPLSANLNALSILCAQATLVSLALALAERSIFRRNILFAVSSFCLVATFLPMSRSGVASVIIFLGIIMWKYGLKMKTIVASIALCGCILILVPDVIVSRLTVSTETRQGKRDARLHLYQVALEHLPEYIMTGVGVGNFWGPWGMKTGFYKRTYGIVYGPHNSYIMVTIYWGLAGLVLFLNLLYQAYRCLPPKQLRLDPLAVCVLGIAVSLLLMTFYSHRIAGKEFSLGLGLLVGAYTWIWSKKKQSLNKQRTVDFSSSLHKADAP